MSVGSGAMSTAVGVSVGNSVGVSVGNSVGVSLGKGVAVSPGRLVGVSDGISVGVSVGKGVAVGVGVGSGELGSGVLVGGDWNSVLALARSSARAKVNPANNAMTANPTSSTASRRLMPWVFDTQRPQQKGLDIRQRSRWLRQTDAATRRPTSL